MIHTLVHVICAFFFSFSYSFVFFFFLFFYFSWGFFFGNKSWWLFFISFKSSYVYSRWIQWSTIVDESCFPPLLFFTLSSSSWWPIMCFMMAFLVVATQKSTCQKSQPTLLVRLVVHGAIPRMWCSSTTTTRTSPNRVTFATIAKDITHMVAPSESPNL